MAYYDYKNGKSRVEEILDNDLKIIESNSLPNDDKLTYDNGYYSWVTAVFVDIRKSTELFTEENKEMVSKIIRSFTSEIIEILKQGDNLREIGIRGDCVYAIYTTPSKEAVYEISEKTFFVNTYIKMLNELLRKRGFPEIKVGIGMATAQELVVKAGRKGTGINNKVWIGNAVTRASNLSALGNKNGNKSLVFSASSYNNFINELQDRVPKENVKSWFEYKIDNGGYYTAGIVVKDFNDWINNGMKE